MANQGSNRKESSSEISGYMWAAFQESWKTCQIIEWWEPATWMPKKLDFNVYRNLFVPHIWYMYWIHLWTGAQSNTTLSTKGNAYHSYLILLRLFYSVKKKGKESRHKLTVNSFEITFEGFVSRSQLALLSSTLPSRSPPNAWNWKNESYSTQNMSIC